MIPMNGFIFRGWCLLPDPPAVSSGMPSARKSVVSTTKISKDVHKSISLSDYPDFALDAQFFQSYCVLISESVLILCPLIISSVLSCKL